MVVYEYALGPIVWILTDGLRQIGGRCATALFGNGVALIADGILSGCAGIRRPAIPVRSRDRDAVRTPVAGGRTTGIDEMTAVAEAQGLTTAAGRFPARPNCLQVDRRVT